MWRHAQAESEEGGHSERDCCKQFGSRPTGRVLTHRARGNAALLSSVPLLSNVLADDRRELPIADCIQTSRRLRSIMGWNLHWLVVAVS